MANPFDPKQHGMGDEDRPPPPPDWLTEEDSTSLPAPEERAGEAPKEPESPKQTHKPSPTDPGFYSPNQSDYDDDDNSGFYVPGQEFPQRDDFESFGPKTPTSEFRLPPPPPPSKQGGTGFHTPASGNSFSSEIPMLGSGETEKEPSPAPPRSPKKKSHNVTPLPDEVREGRQSRGEFFPTSLDEEDRVLMGGKDPDTGGDEDDVRNLPPPATERGFRQPSLTELRKLAEDAGAEAGAEGGFRQPSVSDYSAPPNPEEPSLIKGAPPQQSHGFQAPQVPMDPGTGAGGTRVSKDQYNFEAAHPATPGRGTLGTPGAGESGLHRPGEYYPTEAPSHSYVEGPEDQEWAKQKEADHPKAVFARRAVGVVYFIMAGFLFIGNVAASQDVRFSTADIGSGIGIPVLMGILLMTGTRWSAITTLVLSSLWGLALIVLGGIAGAGMELLGQMGGVELFPPWVFGSLAGVGLFLVLGNFLALIGKPGGFRLFTGAVLILAPLVAWGTFMATYEVIPKLRNPISTFAEQTISNPQAGYVLEKPAGWATYNWEMVRGLTVQGLGLETLPHEYFLNRDQSLMVALYSEPASQAGLSLLTGGLVDSPTDLENEISRTLPEKRQSSFNSKGLEWKETVYEGPVSFHDQQITITVAVDKAVVGERQFYVVCVAKESGNVDAKMNQALDLFFAGLDFQNSQ